MKIARRCFVSGRVQGVFFRASTASQARNLGLRGYARNLADGRVEVLIAGEAAAVESLVEWLWQGPPMSRVTNVEKLAVDDSELAALAAEFQTG